MKEQRMQRAIRLMINSVLTVGVVLLTVGFFTIVSEAATGTIKSSNVNVRSEASASSTAVATVTTNDSVTIESQTTGADGLVWYKIKTSGGVTGYVRSDFVTKNAETVETNTTVTPTDSKTAYVAGTGSVRIRIDASTSSDLVASAKGGTQLTITGEATASDGYKWYQISFEGNGTTMKGFIRSDLVTFTAPVSEPEKTEILGSMGESAEPTEPVSEEKAPIDEPAATPEPESTIPAGTASATELNILQPTGVPEVIPAGFQAVTLDLGDRQVDAWFRGDFYILYASKADGTQGWFLYDYQNRSYLRCEGLFSAGEDTVNKVAEDGLNFKLITIILAVVVVIAIGIIAFMGYKLANIEYDDYDEYDEDEEPEPEPVRERAVVSSRQTERKPERKQEQARRQEPERKQPAEKKKSVGRKFFDYFTEEVEDDEYEEEAVDSDSQEDIDYIDF